MPRRSEVGSVVLEQIFGELEPNHLKDAGKDVGERWERSGENSTEHGQVAAIKAAEAHDLQYTDQVAD